jgi:uncharacterized protein (TIGR03435 family)
MTRMIVAAGFVMVAGSVAAQQPAFDVVSIKANVGVSIAMNNRFSPGRMILINYSPDVLIRQAHGVNGYQIVNLPEWARNERFDVEATFPPNAPPAQRPQMLQAMLAERFGLQVHRETRELPIYALVRVKPDALGPGLQPSTRDCTVQKDATGRVIPDPNCGFRITQDSVSGNAEWRQLSLPLQLGIRDRPVLDRTGLTGRFDIKLQWLPEGAPDSGERVSIFTALQEQLGLRLESTKSPVEVLVIDNVSRPTPD